MFMLHGRLGATSGNRDELLTILQEDEGAEPMPGCRLYLIAVDESDTDGVSASRLEQRSGPRFYALVMSLRSAAGQYLIAAVVFLGIDLVWLGLVAPDLYDHFLGDLLADSPNVAAAAVFYAIFVGGLVYFVIAPAVEERSLRTAMVRGAAFGFVTYATWDLTSLAVIEGFPVGIVPIDLAWGSFLAASVSAATYLLWVRVVERRTDPEGVRRG
jgi:uncharacterized membrane protein